MDYFELFNKVLLELNLRPVNEFKQIYKSEHKKILNAINLVNREVLSAYDWPFLIRKRFIDIIAGEIACKIPESADVKSVYHKNVRLKFVENPENIIHGKVSGEVYSILNNAIIFPKSTRDRLYSVYLYTKEYVADEGGEFKTDFEFEHDSSVIPMPYAEGILVYGTALKIKANPAYPKFGFWNTMYIRTLANLRQKSPRSRECEPFIKI